MAKDRLQRIIFKGREIISIDYRYCKEQEPIALTMRHKELILSENKESFFLANYEHTYGTAGYMKAAKDFTESTKHLVTKGAFLGITGPKVILLQGITFFIDVNFKTFDSEPSALEWLVS
jgi:hypothetical protein